MSSSLLPSGADPLDFFLKLSDGEKYPAFFTSGDRVIIAWNPIETFTADDADAWQALKRFTSRTLSMSRSGRSPSHVCEPLLIGYLSYDLGHDLHGIKSSTHENQLLPLMYVHAYDQCIAFHRRSGVIDVVGHDSYRDAVTDIHQRMSPQVTLPSVRWQPRLSKEAYARAFAEVQEGIRSGEFYQLNLTYPLEAMATIDPRQFFVHHATRNPAPCAAYIEGDDFAVASLSPEHFVTIDDRTVTTHPIKGTRPRGATPAEDDKMMHELLASPKERAELTMITDLLRNDLGQIAELGSVRVLRDRYILETPNVWHTAAEIQATIQPHYSNIDVLQKMFPGGSVTGCPKARAMETIDRIEDTARGPYCGAMIMLDGAGNLDSSILIRTVVATKKNQKPKTKKPSNLPTYLLSLSIGGGIVADSTMEAEWEETRKKAEAFAVEMNE